MNTRETYSKIASLFHAYLTCVDSGNTEWEDKHSDTIEFLVKNFFPSGSGFDSGTEFDFDKSKPERLIFKAPFHHMDDMGGYDGWTEHEVIITPSLELGYKMRVTGKNKNGIKEYITECFSNITND